MGRLYDLALTRLLAAGFRQVTMRQFRRDAVPEEETEDVEYRCQRDGMVGLGAGARSYTRALHYSTPWRMVARNIRTVVDTYEKAMRSGDLNVSYGFLLDSEEQLRRFVIQSLLSDGLNRHESADWFGIDPGVYFAPQWEALAAEDCVRAASEWIRLTNRGVRHADVVGQLFFSERVKHLMATYEYDT
jgi:oxygen-independent coproporphyrinogen-3 oxidase